MRTACAKFHGSCLISGEGPGNHPCKEVSMRSLIQTIFLAAVVLWAWPVAAQQQQSCSNYSIVVNSPEDKLMLAVNGSDDPNAKIAGLEKFAQEHADSAYMPCVE